MGNLFGRKGILNNVGDILQARITHDNKKILKKGVILWKRNI